MNVINVRGEKVKIIGGQCLLQSETLNVILPSFKVVACRSAHHDTRG